MNNEVDSKYTYSHGYSVGNVGSLIACFSGSAVLYHEYMQNSQLWVLAIAICLTGLSLFALDLIVTTVKIYGDKINLYIRPSQPLTLKKRFTFKRSEIKRTRVDTEKRNSRYGPIVTYSVSLTTKNGKKHVIFIPRNKVEAIRVKKAMSRFRHA